MMSKCSVHIWSPITSHVCRIVNGPWRFLHLHSFKMAFRNAREILRELADHTSVRSSYLADANRLHYFLIYMNIYGNAYTPTCLGQIKKTLMLLNWARLFQSRPDSCWTVLKPGLTVSKQARSDSCWTVLNVSK